MHLRDRDDEATRRSTKVGNALKFGTALWSTSQDGVDKDIPIDRRGCMQVPAASAKAAPKKQFPAQRRAQRATATFYNKWRKPVAQQWLTELTTKGRVCPRRKVVMRPNPEQVAVSQDILDRCAVEAELERRHGGGRQRGEVAEPLRSLTQGIPGAGKSQLLKWIRAFFEEVLGWQHGIEFVFIASMNTMAALIDGFTIHSFGDILVDTNKRQAKKSKSWAAPNLNKMWERIQNLRWVLMDEGSTASGEILNILESNLRTSTREQNAGVGYKLRSTGEERPFGGLNV